MEARHREKVEDELRRGRVWRAKEILRGHIAADPYDPELYQIYGEVLFSTGELLEAGKYLLLSGSNVSEHREAVALFVQRTSRNGPLQLFSTLPVKARLPQLSDYPEPVASRLREAGLPEQLPVRSEAVAASTPSRTVGLLISLALLVLLACAVVGAVTVITWFF